MMILDYDEYINDDTCVVTWYPLTYYSITDID